MRLSWTALLPQHEASFTCRCNTYYLLCSWGFISISDSRWKIRQSGDAITRHGPRHSSQTQTAAVAAAYAKWSSQTPAFDSGLWTGAKMWHVYVSRRNDRRQLSIWGGWKQCHYSAGPQWLNVTAVSVITRLLMSFDVGIDGPQKKSDSDWIQPPWGYLYLLSMCLYTKVKSVAYMELWCIWIL